MITSMDPKKGGVSQAVRNMIFDNNFGYHEVVCLDPIGKNYELSDKFTINQIGLGFTGYQYHKGLLIWLINNIFSFDVVIIHGIWQFHHIAVYLALKKIGLRNSKPIICVMPHGMLDPYFQKDPSRKFKALRNELLWRITECKALNSADAVLFTCEQELILARQTFSGYQPKVEVNVGLGVSTPPVFVSSMRNAFQSLLPNVSQYWLYLSRIHPKKGVDLLLEAYIKLQKTNENLPDLVIAGPIDSNFAYSLQQRFGNSSKVHFTGMLKGDAKWGAIYGCDCFILPSHQENFGIAIVEALACGKPVLITDQVNIYREIVEEGAGLIGKDSVQGILNLLSNFHGLEEEEVQQMKFGAQKLYREKFAIGKVAASFFNSVKNIAGTKSI